MFPAAPAVNDAHIEGAQLYWWSGAAWMRGRSPGPGGHDDFGGNIGEVLSWFKTAVPVNFLLCDGAAFDPLIYPDLALLLGINNVPLLNDYVSMGVNNAGLGSRLPHALAAPRTPLLAHFAVTIGHVIDPTDAVARDHNHASFAGAVVVGWTGTSDHAYQTDGHEGNRDYGATQSSYAGAHRHRFTPVHAPVQHTGPNVPHPWHFTTRPIIRALLP